MGMINMMEILTFKKGIYQYYKQHIKGSENISLDLAQRKMTRNMMLAKYVGNGMYQYGKLWFIVEDNAVIWMCNYCNIPPNWKKNIKKYQELNLLLGIFDDSQLAEAK
jgi:hypothetical protein